MHMACVGTLFLLGLWWRGLNCSFMNVVFIKVLTQDLLRLFSEI